MMRYNLIKGLEKKISRLILGNDKVQKIDEAVKIWDKWIDEGKKFSRMFII